MLPSFDLTALRRELPILQEWTYLGTGTLGVMAQPILNTLLERIARFEADGMAARDAARADYERARQRIALLIGAEARDVALLRNASDGVNIVTAGFALQPGDEVITSTAEGLEAVLPLVAACQRSGAYLRYIDLTHDPDQLTERLQATLTPYTKLVFLSQVSCEWGTRVPVEIIREVVGPDVTVVIDGAQSVGQFAVNVAALNADVFISNGHKWLCGPKGTAFTWFAPEAIERFPPLQLGFESAEPAWDRHYYQQEPPPLLGVREDATRYEFGTRAWPLFGGLADAIDYQEAFGWSAIHDHMRAMSDLAKSRLEELPGVELVTPRAWEHSGSFVTFTVAGHEGHALRDRLRDEFKITQRSTEIPSAVRVGCAYFTAPEDIERLIAALEQIVASA